jgi:hypothetical protein
MTELRGKGAMSLIRLNTTPSRGELRGFGILWLIFLGLAGALAWHKGAHGLAGIIWFIGGAVSGPGLICPPLLRYLYLAAIYTSFPIGVVSSHLILAIVYYLVLTPVGLMMRLFGNDPLTRRFQPGQTTYWKPRGAPQRAQNYFRQH